MIRDNYLDINKLIKNKKILRLFLVVKHHGGVLRFVGGAVRDALRGIEGSDLDFATDLSPDELAEACAEEGLKTVPIGIKYGTIGVMIDDKLVEVTSLRKDIKTDGRHAEVEFTDNWEEDASRRDLTINAVYADEKGNVFDYYNGIEDLEKGKVRFIGSASQRIKEDYLRILRFFRFYSLFGIGKPDKKALDACIENREGLKNLSMERIRDELFKLMLTPKAAETMQIIQDNNILSYVMPDAKRIDALSFLMKLTASKNIPGKPLRRIFTIYQPDKNLAENLAVRLRLSRKEKQEFIRWAETDIPMKDFLEDNSLRRIIYIYGKEFVADKFLLKMAKDKEVPPAWEFVWDNIQKNNIPVFPLKGKDLIDKGGVLPQEVGKHLKALETLWINSNFSMSKKELLEQISSLSKAI